MIKKYFIKRTTAFTAALLLTICVSCYTKDDKNVAEPYPTTDTTQNMENKNDDVARDTLSRAN
ncbi:MAG: hypothetical protein HYX39_13325 [Bacteroidetes bacterium]|nr:hypothetical protein [Bacteroidota bacterium]